MQSEQKMEIQKSICLGIQMKIITQRSLLNQLICISLQQRERKK